MKSFVRAYNVQILWNVDPAKKKKKSLCTKSGLLCLKMIEGKNVVDSDTACSDGHLLTLEENIWKSSSVFIYAAIIIIVIFSGNVDSASMFQLIYACL